MINVCPRCDSMRVEIQSCAMGVCKNCAQRWKGKIVLRQRDTRCIAAILFSPLRRFLRRRMQVVYFIFL